MNADPKKTSDDRVLDEVLRGHNALEEDVKKKREELEHSQATHSEDLLDEALDETFPASDPVAVHGAAREAERFVVRKKARRRIAKKTAAKAKSKKKAGKKKPGKRRPARRRRT